MAGAENSYEESSARELDLRDHLAINRTILSNERTLLAYVRTALALMVVGASCIKLFTSRLAVAGGWGFIALALALMLIGAWRFNKTRRRISAVQPSSD